jgi:hypothetical protein
MFLCLGMTDEQIRKVLDDVKGTEIEVGEGF